MDLRNLHAGDYTFNGVPFRVEKGNACFIMKNKQCPSENLPKGGKVMLGGKADVLALLHTGAWIDQDVRQAVYVIHYSDGGKAEIPVVGGKNILDWTEHTAISREKLQSSESPSNSRARGKMMKSLRKTSLFQDMAPVPHANFQ